MKPSKPDRRQFLKRTISSAALIALGRATAAAAAEVPVPDPTKRRYLVNIMIQGGYDSLVGFNAVPTNEILKLARTSGGSLVTSQNGNLSFLKSDDILAPFQNPSPYGMANARDPRWDIRFPDYNPNNPAEQYCKVHPLTRSAAHTMGPLANIFSPEDLAEICILRGGQPEGGHGTGNRLDQTGTTGNQSASYPALVASILAARNGNKKLHYLSICESNPNEMFNQSGPLGGPALPINVKDSGAWGDLTSLSASDLPAQRRQFMNDAIAKAGASALAVLQLSRSRTSLQGFLQGNQDAYALSSTGYAVSPEFTALWNDYKVAIMSMYSTHIFTTWFPRMKSMTAADLGSNSYDPYVDALQKIAFRYALAEFAIRKDLAAVIDLPMPQTDFHNYWDQDCVQALAVYTCFRKIIRNLKATPLPGAAGSSLLSVTTLMLGTEFDRDKLLWAGGPGITGSGTGHHEMTKTLLMAGAGVNGGKVVGEIQRGPDGLFAAQFPQSSFQPFDPLPINQATGLADPSGTFWTARMIFPTVLSIFNASSASPVNGGSGPIRAAMK